MSDAIDNSNEVWKTIEEFPNYSVSTLGRVKSHNTRNSGRKAVDGVLKPGTNRDGYLHVVLFRSGIRKNVRIHRLVAGAFVARHPYRYEVNHKNGIKSDNRCENLEWVTAQENIQHSYSVLGNPGMIGERNGRTRLTDEVVLEIKKVMRDQPIDSILAKHFGTSRGAIWRIRNNVNWTHIAGP